MEYTDCEEFEQADNKLEYVHKLLVIQKGEISELRRMFYRSAKASGDTNWDTRVLAEELMRKQQKMDIEISHLNKSINKICNMVEKLETQIMNFLNEKFNKYD